MPPTGKTFEDRLAHVESILDTAPVTEDRKAGNTLRQLQNVEVFVRKLQAKAGSGAAVSTYSSACTSACFSSASSVCASGALAAATKDPELAQIFATLHTRGVAVLGEEGLMAEMLKQAKAHKPLNIFEAIQIAETK